MKRETFRKLTLALGLLLVISSGRVLAEQDEGTSSSSATDKSATETKSNAGESAATETGGEPIAPAEAAASSTTEAATTSEESAVSAAQTPSPGGLISVDFKDADIRQVLRIISLKSGVDIVAGTDVEGLVTIKLTNVPWEQALEIILRTYGYTYERKGRIVRVMTVAELEKEALATDVFPLNYAKAKEVPDIIGEMLSDRGKIKFDERTNTVIVTDIPSNLFQIKQVVERLDQRTPQALIEAKIVETKLNRNEKLGIDWSSSLTLTNTSPTITSTFPFLTGASLGKFGEKFIPQASATASPTGGSFLGGRVPTTGGTFTFGTLGVSTFSTVLNFLNSRTNTNIVSNPSIAVLNNQQAKIHIGAEYPIPNYTIEPTTGKTTISGFSAKNIGTILTVTPHVNPSEEIVVDILPEVIASTEKVEFSTGQGSTVSLPQFTIQTAQTQVRIRSGETIAIGGLIKEAKIHKETKVPLLGDIPVVGWLFKNISKNESAGASDPERQDLLIFLTVKLMKEPPISQAIASAITAGGTP